jgi:hypothetical protein
MAKPQAVLKADRPTTDCDEFTLRGGSCWITVENLSIWLRRMDGNEGLVIEVYPMRREAQDGPITGVGIRFEEGQVS